MRTIVEVTDKASAKYIDVTLTYYGRVLKAELEEEYIDDDLTDTETQNRIAVDTVRQWIHDGECCEADPITIHTDED